MHQINTFQQVSAKQSIWQWLHPLRCYCKSAWFWHFFVIKPHFSPNRKMITAQCYARYLTELYGDQHFFSQFIFRRVAFERRPILLASRIPQYQRLAHMEAAISTLLYPYTSLHLVYYMHDPLNGNASYGKYLHQPPHCRSIKSLAMEYYAIDVKTTRLSV